MRLSPSLALPALLLLATCREADPALPPVGPDLVASREAACTASGGRWGAGGKGLFICYRTTADAGRPCAAAGDCEGLCLAPSRSCAPVDPLFGCNEVLDALGRATTLCID